MANPNKDIVTLYDHGVVTEEALVAYLHNKLSEYEKQELEKLLEQDPFAREAMDGLKQAENKGAVSSSLSYLHKKVRERSGLKEKRSLQIHWTNYAWAAVVLGLLIGIGFIMIYFVGKKHEQISINSKAKQEEEQK